MDERPLPANQCTSEKKIVALVVAAGRGSRLEGAGATQAKQYLDLGGKAVLAWSLEALAGHSSVSAIQVVIHSNDQQLYDDVIVAWPADTKDKFHVPVFGGATRQMSVMKGLNAVRDAGPDVVLIHDAARPFLPARVIDDLLAALTDADGAIPALAVADTLKRRGADNRIEATVPRDGLWQAQTPQAFRYDVICAAHEAGQASGCCDFTDDASIAEDHGSGVVIIPGDSNLRKITTADDLTWARTRAKSLNGGKCVTEMETRVGQGFDVHAFADGDAVILCGVHIPYAKSLSGHSDADVGLHALTDAILGALGDGDIGTHFPPSDPQWCGADSVAFLEDAVRRIGVRGGRLVHADVTLICEQPKIGPHRDAMTRRLSNILDIADDRISIKATTTERLGFTGREEGIAALATATVALPAGD